MTVKGIGRRGNSPAVRFIGGGQPSEICALCSTPEIKVPAVRSAKRTRHHR
jgi:hypothetical protein